MSDDSGKTHFSNRSVTCSQGEHNECMMHNCVCACHMPARLPASVTEAEQVLRKAFPGAETAKTPDRGGQPVPIPTDGPSMHDLLIEQIIARKELGLSRYGTILQAGNGRDALKDMLDELIDAAVYCLQLIEERKRQAIVFEAIQRQLSGINPL